jgi:tRNA U34 2-thiouridine synthase MnmA/TrmU
MSNRNNGEASGQTQKHKALVLLSGGLDSMLAVKLILNQGIEAEAVHFVTPFCLCNRCTLHEFAKDLSLKVHRIFLGEESLKIVVDPPHGYGSHMNPCMDCRILMFKKAKILAEKTGADFIATGEVLNERPFSQRKEVMLHIEREAGLEGRILRPLSAKVLPESEPEKKGLVDREQLHAIRGRRRLPQIELAKELNVRDYPCPSGGCLLTDPRFSERLKEHLEHKNKLTISDVTLLKVGRHFRIGKEKTIVGRNEEENTRLLAIADTLGAPWLQAIDYKGPITLLIGEEKPQTVEVAAAITARYSDAPKDITVRITFKGHKERILEVKPVANERLEKYMI